MDPSSADHPHLGDAAERLLQDSWEARGKRASRDGLSPADRSLGACRAEALLDRLDELALDLYGITSPEERASVLALGAPLD
jgi:hypothetical protein